MVKRYKINTAIIKYYKNKNIFNLFNKNNNNNNININNININEKITLI